ncbi:MAG: ATP-binding cassette domain-containing protein [Clostridia bacterium]|nr:ATP-binding cassette domain-containing protein [Clostridia bacterium]
MSLLVLNNIVKEYRNRLVLDGASLRIEKGERVALVGPNGSGKTTLLRIAAGFESCDSGNVMIARGTKMGYLTQDLREMDPAGKIFKETALYHEEVSRLEQKIQSLEKKMAEPALMNIPEEYNAIVTEYSRLINRFESLDGYAIESKIKSMLLGLGLKEEALTLPLELLSGGEKMRVALARILLEEPDLLILDEPTNHLDIDAVEWLEGFLRRFDGGILVVSHDRYFLDQVATRVAELGNGTIAERSGNYSTFMEQKNRMREFALKEQFRLRQEIKRETAIAEQLKSSKKISAWKSRLKTVQRLQKELDQDIKEMKEQHHLYQTTKPKVAFDTIKHMSAEIATADRLSKFYGSYRLFSNVNFLIRGGEKVGIIGPNGCGKTTLINILLGKDEDFEGIGKLGEWVRYGYLGQEVDFEDEGHTVLEELLAVKEMTVEAARDYLSRFQFYGDEVDKKIEVLSGGERVRLYLGCMMLESPDCLILDEPTNHLDVPARDALETALLEFRGTVIAISHDRYFLNRCINRILEFSDGTLRSINGNYEVYRHKKIEIQSEKQADKGRKNTAVNKMLNRPDRAASRQKADKKIDIDQLEGRITELEEKRKELESSFGVETPLEKYIEYDELIKELENLYELYVDLESTASV